MRESAKGGHGSAPTKCNESDHSTFRGKDYGIIPVAAGTEFLTSSLGVTMRRKLFAYFAAFSLLLCAATALLQVRGYTFLGDSLGVWHFGVTGVLWPHFYDWTMRWTFIPLFAITIVTLLPPIFATRTLSELANERRLFRGLTADTSAVCPECGRKLGK